MNNFWKKKLKNLKNIFSEKNINVFMEFILVFCLSLIATLSIFGTPNFFILDKDQVVIMLTIIGLSIAYASFFISNSDKLVEGDNRKKVVKLSKILIVSPIFSIFSILLAQSKVDLGKFNIYVAWTLSILTIISVFAFFFYFLKLLLILIKSVFEKK